MDVKTFVAETLTQIVAGVQQARDEIQAMGVNARVNPASISADQRDEVGRASSVDFDIAVTVVEESEEKAGSKAKAGIAVVSMFAARASGEIEGQQTGGRRNESVSRVKFSVNLAQPADVSRRQPDRMQSASSVW